jgi:hypothetical protein
MSAAMLHAGLCSQCRHARPIVNDRGSRFLLCQLALTDTRYRKYPALPVLKCAGYAMPEEPSAPRPQDEAPERPC